MNVERIADSREALLMAMHEFGPSSWVAVTYAGIKCIGNGRGDAGRGATWEDALATLRAKNGAREARLREIAAHEAARGRVSRNAALVLGTLLIVGLCAAAAWWAAR